MVPELNAVAWFESVISVNDEMKGPVLQYHCDKWSSASHFIHFVLKYYRKLRAISDKNIVCSTNGSKLILIYAKKVHVLCDFIYRNVLSTVFSKFRSFELDYALVIYAWNTDKMKSNADKYFILVIKSRKILIFRRLNY